jgi:dihydropteroate synthase
MTTLVMGVLNVTPDSFSDGGHFADPRIAIDHGHRMLAEGASIIDVGGESTRPGAEPVTIDEELSRVIPVVEGLAGSVRVSIDTRHGAVARAAIDAGATMINDVSASLFEVAAETKASWVAMHMKGEPTSMQQAPEYDDVVVDVSTYLFERAAKATAAGVSDVWIDPGIGFGKSVEHNLSLLNKLDVFTASPWKVLVGASRKSFIGRLTETSSGIPEPSDRLEGSLAAAVLAASQGAAMIRVHDVAETVRALRIADAIGDAA